MSATQIIKPRNGELTFRGRFPSSYNELKEMIEDYNSYMEEIRKKVNMLAISHPTDLFSNNNLIDNIQNYVDELFDEIRINTVMLYSLNTIKSLIDEYVTLDNMNEKDAFDKVVVDMYKDLRNQIEK